MTGPLSQRASSRRRAMRANTTTNIASAFRTAARAGSCITVASARREGPADSHAWRVDRHHIAQAGRRGNDAPAARHRPRRSRVGDGSARLRARARDQSAAGSDPAQRRGRCAVPTRPLSDLVEIGAIVDDIRKDDERASAVIDRMRALLRRQAVEMIPLDLNQVLVDVTTLLRADAAARHVQVDVKVVDRLPQGAGGPRATATGAAQPDHQRDGRD